MFIGNRQSNQAMLSLPYSLKFVGEYSQNGGDWQTLGEDTDLSAFDGDLTLQGRFDTELPEGATIQFYLDHIGMTISVNGDDTFEMSNELFPELCGAGWVDWDMPALSEEDVIEIKLHNPHSYGNREAYNEFLDSTYMCAEIILKYYYEKEEMPYRIFCAFVLVASIALIGTAIGYLLLKLPNSTLLIKLGVLSLLMGMFMYFDTKDMYLRNDQIVVNTYVRLLAMMLAAWMCGSAVMEILTEKRKRIAEIAVYVLMAADVMCMAFALGGVMRIYDTAMYWAVVQGIVSLLLIALVIPEIKQKGKQNCFMYISIILLFTVLVAELVNARMSWWQQGMCIKIVFSVLFVIHLIRAVKLIAVNYQASIRAKKLEEELKDNQIALAMSQIQPHFIYNSLNSIYHLCEKDVGMAQQAISDFSDYLQRSLNAVSRTTLIAFEEELKHVKTYLNLEQMRFGEDLHVEYRIETTHFMLPALSVQPLVENAVKHGICKKEDGGGTVTLIVQEYPEYFEIIVSDDGVGFAPTQEADVGKHVGILNVRQRLDILSKGTLEVTSEPGKGTTSTIHIPKEDAS